MRPEPRHSSFSAAAVPAAFPLEGVQFRGVGGKATQLELARHRGQMRG